jgi:hypothetical protein
MDDRQSQPRALPHRFRGEKRLIDSRQNVRGHACTGIADAETDHRARGEGERGHASDRVHLDGLQMHDETPTRVAHGMLSVGGEIHHDLVYLGHVRQDEARLGGQVHF